MRVARRLGLIDVLAIGVNAIVGSGVFSLPDDMHREMGGLSPLAFVLCALVLIPVALCFGELSSRTDRTGGPYLYATEAFGRVVGYVVGWSCYLNAFLSFAANATQLGELVGLGHSIWFRPAVIAIVLGLGAINYVGVRPGALVVVVMTVGKLLAILLFVGAALSSFDATRLGGALPHGASGVANGVYLALFPFQGFEVVPVPAGETKNPERNVPLGTIGSLLFAALLYVIVQATLVASYPNLGADSERPLVDAARHIAPLLGALVLVGSVVSVGGFTAGSALGSPRYAQAIADTGQLPAQLSKVHPRFGTPYVAIVVTTLVTAVLAMFFTYRELVGFSNVTVVFQYAVTCLAVVVLRRKQPDIRPKFRVPFGPVLPVIGFVGSIALLLGSSREEFLYAAIGIALGVLVAWGAYRIFPAPPPASA